MSIDQLQLMLKDYDLGDGFVFRSGQLPAALVWDAVEFDAAWLIHPTEKHEIMMHGRLVETPRWQQAHGADYHYTGSVNKGLPVPQLIVPLLTWVQSQIDPRINGVLVYVDGGWVLFPGPQHDSVRQMIYGSSIVTVSF